MDLLAQSKDLGSEPDFLEALGDVKDYWSVMPFSLKFKINKAFFLRLVADYCDPAGLCRRARHRAAGPRLLPRLGPRRMDGGHAFSWMPDAGDGLENGDPAGEDVGGERRREEAGDGGGAASSRCHVAGLRLAVVLCAGTDTCAARPLILDCYVKVTQVCKARARAYLIMRSAGTGRGFPGYLCNGCCSENVEAAAGSQGAPVSLRSDDPRSLAADTEGHRSCQAIRLGRHHAGLGQHDRQCLGPCGQDCALPPAHL